MHWCLDVTFREDDSRFRDRIAVENTAWLRRFAINLLKQVSDKERIAIRRRMAGWSDEREVRHWLGLADVSDNFAGLQDLGAGDVQVRN